MIYFLLIVLLIALFIIYDPFIDSYTDSKGIHIILWYKSNGERKYITFNNN